MLNSTQLTIRIAAVQGAYGHRLATYATQISPRSLEAFLGHDPRSRFWKKLDPELEQIYVQLQRTTTSDRLRAIQAYIRKRFSQLAVILGAFPAISVAVKRHLRFDPFNESGVEGAGTLHLDMSKSNGRIVLDGLARVSGVIELVELANDEALSIDERRALNELIDQFTLPLVIFAPRQADKPLDLKELRQLFADFNFKQTSISPTMAMNYDSSDIYVEATRRLADRAVIKSNGGMETKAASLGAKSTALVVLQHLVRFVRGAAEGDAFTEAKTNVDKAEGQRRLSEDSIDEFVTQANRFLSGMTEMMGAERFSDTKNSIHLTGPGWGALGTIFHDLDVTLEVDDIAAMGRRLGELDWRRDAEFWSDVMREREVRGKMMLTFVGGGYESRQAIRRKAHQYLGTWDRLQAKTAPSEVGAPTESNAAAA
ncbi:MULTISPECIES: DNA sulfur modification protein DndB [unclassified Mesorhizobium]|uniref:DNA sulfur modification protein DndB n=1 Tax=unclassified Mesorhizobium TaxID=325217 RepID=UPI0015E3051D|nr:MULTISPECIES: DNA sulfur modification protein DndB [unclassified Mesorhizobium]